VPSPAPTFPSGWCGKGGRSQTTHRSLRSLMRLRQRSPSVSAFGRNRLWFDEQRLERIRFNPARIQLRRSSWHIRWE
jgi:hypothetical protein